MKNYVIGLTLALFFSTACKEGTKELSEKKPTVPSNGEPSPSPSSSPSSDGNDGFFTGYDGQTDFSLLVPNFRTLTIEDTSVARIEQVKINLPEATITELVEKIRTTLPEFDEERFKRMFSRMQTVNKITPLKAGKTIIKTSGGRGGSPGKGQSGWGRSQNIDLVVTAYTADQLQVGKSRYTTDAGGNLRACSSCHESRQEGAPPHELGRIMELSDADALKWLKTGEAKGRTAKITHKWEFSDAAEETGVVAYLRSKQTHDVETLAKLFVEEFIANGMNPMGRP